MRYYFTTPERMLESLQRHKGDYINLYNWLMAPFNAKVDYYLQEGPLIKEFNYFMLESCRYFVDGKDYDHSELLAYHELLKEASDKLLIDMSKIQEYFHFYIDALLRGMKKGLELDHGPPINISELVIQLMLSELDITDMLAHINLGTQEVDIQSIKDSVRLEKINFVKRMIHDRVLFFIEYYNNRHESL